MAKQGLKVSTEALRAVLKSDSVHGAVFGMARRACDAANEWAAGQPRSGRHRNEHGPHFEVVKEVGRNRARYTVRPRTGFGTWLVQSRPAEFMGCLEAARG